MTAISKKLRQLNLRGVDKATAIATAQYIENLEKELSLYKSLEARGNIVRVKFAIGSCYFTPTKVCTGFFKDGQEVEVTDDMCLDCGQASCTGFCSFVPKKKIVNSLDVAVMLNNNQLAFKSEAECKRYCQRRNKELLKNKITAKKVSSDMSTYKPRADLSEEHVEKLRRADRDYYEDHKEEVNQKDRDKYHRLHPNARYYKPRKPKEEKAKNGQLPGRLSFEDIGVNIPTENS